MSEAKAAYRSAEVIEEFIRKSKIQENTATLLRQ